MIEVVVPDVFDGHDQLDDARLSLDREMVDRHIYAFDGPLDEALALAEQLSEKSQRDPVLVNDVTSESKEARVVDVYMHQGGRQVSVSEGVERPRPD